MFHCSPTGKAWSRLAGKQLVAAERPPKASMRDCDGENGNDAGNKSADGTGAHAQTPAT
jgi:hypothetical protein